MSTLNVDALVGNTSANAITVRGEGTATTSLQQGLGKAWNNVTQGTSAIQDSYNISSISDDATGRFTQNYTNNMSNDLFSVSGTCQNAGNIATTGTFGSSATQFQTVVTSTASANDYDDACNSVHGDLA
tara:strand:- start:787 stop:1173 length:387 start_codon:yes stop_codon:yes gene_type:complete